MWFFLSGVSLLLFSYYTFVTSPFLSESPSPAPVCSICGGPNRLDLWCNLCLKLLFDFQKIRNLTNGVAGDICLEFVVIFVRFWRPITLLSPKNIPGTHQYAVSHCGANCGADFGVRFKKNLVDKVSCYMNFFLILPNKYYTFVTSPFHSASPSPAPVCSICGSPNRLDLWLNLCLKLLFDFQKI